MKKLRLRKGVKVGLIGMVVVSLFMFNNSQYNKAVEQCVNRGHEYNYCVEGLR